MTNSDKKVRIRYKDINIYFKILNLPVEKRNIIDPTVQDIFRNYFKNINNIKQITPKIDITDFEGYLLVNIMLNCSFYGSCVYDSGKFLLDLEKELDLPLGSVVTVRKKLVKKVDPITPVQPVQPIEEPMKDDVKNEITEPEEDVNKLLLALKNENMRLKKNLRTIKTAPPPVCNIEEPYEKMAKIDESENNNQDWIKYGIIFGFGLFTGLRFKK